ncbi:MAG TPA: lipopolysaccharide biosynthesis protein [Steroidobacter sp.]|nr:lipopolysaccharide biosynthesis protein [Steroidobacter sp.]
MSRLMNHGLVLISPMVLVRLLSVEDFGRYREFLIYTTILASVAAFGVNSSLLRFVPHRPEQRWRFVNQALVITATSSIVVLGVTALLNAVFDGALVGEYMPPLALYVGFFVNFDYWEQLWLAERRAAAVFGYTSGRLLARLTVVIAAAALTGDLGVIIWSLVALEAVRLAASILAWSRLRQPVQGPLPGSWSEQLRFCLPVGGASVLMTFNKSLGSLFVAKMMGPVGLAHYAIGTYVQPVITVLRDSMSDALLPEMAARQPGERSDPLHMWRRMTIAAAIALIGAAVVLMRFAELIVVTLFSEEYRPAVIVFQIYLLVLVREIMDFAVPLRAISRTAPIMRGNLLSLCVNTVLLLLLLPRVGVAGAAAAFVAARSAEALYLGLQTARAYGIRPRALADWRGLGKVGLAAGLASVTLYGSFWTDALGLLGVMAGGACFLLAYLALLVWLRVPEAQALLGRLQQLGRSFHASA